MFLSGFVTIRYVDCHKTKTVVASWNAVHSIRCRHGRNVGGRDVHADKNIVRQKDWLQPNDGVCTIPMAVEIQDLSEQSEHKIMTATFSLSIHSTLCS